MLEARDRVGGRVWSRGLPNGAVVEMGAEYILPGNTAVRELAERFGLGLWDKGMRYGDREPARRRRRRPTRSWRRRWPRRAAGGARAEARADLSARDFLEGLDIPPGAREAMLARVRDSSANSADLVAARELAGVAHVDDEPAPSIAGGNQRLPLALAAALGAAVRLRHAGGSRSRGATTACACARPAASSTPMSASSRCRRASWPDRLRPGAAAGSRARSPGRYGHAAKLFVPLRAPAPPSAVMAFPSATGAGPRPATVGAPSPS